MRFKKFLLVILSVLLFGLSGCGSSGSAGLNGAIELTSPVLTGSVITAEATYTNPDTTNLIGVPITFSYRVGNTTTTLGTFNTNNSGAVGIAFTPSAFNGTQVVTIIAQTANLTDFQAIEVTGRSLIVTAPTSLALTTTAAAGTDVAFTIPAATTFATITDPFTNDLNTHPVTIARTFNATTTGTGTVTLASDVTTTNVSGVASFPGATGTIRTPDAAGATEIITITWIVTDNVTNQVGTAVTTVTLTKSP